MSDYEKEFTKNSLTLGRIGRAFANGLMFGIPRQIEAAKIVRETAKACDGIKEPDKAEACDVERAKRVMRVVMSP